MAKGGIASGRFASTMIALVRSLLAWFMATAVGETGLWKQVFRKTVLLQ